MGVKIYAQTSQHMVQHVVYESDRAYCPIPLRPRGISPREDRVPVAPRGTFSAYGGSGFAPKWPSLRGPIILMMIISVDPLSHGPAFFYSEAFDSANFIPAK